MKITYATYMAKTASGFSGVLYFYLFTYLFIYLFIYFLEWAEHVNTGKVWTAAASRKKELQIIKVSAYVWAEPREQPAHLIFQIKCIVLVVTTLVKSGFSRSLIGQIE